MTISSRKRQRAFMSGASLLIASIAGTGAASAEEADEQTRAAETVIVTGLRERQTAAGTKTETPLMATPQTITVLDSEELSRRNALSLNQALGYVAGVSPNQRGGMVTRYDQLILRGFAPGVFLDGMRLLAGPYSMPQIDFNRVDRIDVVKGPASVLYGNSTPGGVVNLSSKLPEEKPAGRVELQAGNFATARAVADVNQPLDGEGRLRARFVGGWQQSDGFTDGTFSERFHLSPMLAFVPDERTSVTLLATYQRSPSGGGYSGVPAYGSVLQNPFGALPRDINTGDPAYERYDHRAKSIALLARHMLADALTLRTNVRYQNNRLSYRQLYVAGFASTGTGTARNTDFSTINRGGGGADEDFDTLTVDSSLTARFATGAAAHTLLVGADLQRITGENYQQFNTGVTANPLTSIPGLNLFAPTYGGTMPSFDLTVLSPSYTNSYSDRRQIGLYVQDQVAIGRLQLIASGRYDWYRQRSLNRKNNVTTPLDQQAFTARLGALYELPGGLAPYVSFSQSFEPQTGSTYDGVPFDPVTGRQLEAGIKYQPPGTEAIFTLSAYDLRRQKVPVGHPQAGTNGIPSTAQIQIGEVRVRGFELEGRGEVRPGLTVVLALSHTDAIITHGAPAVAPTATNSGTPSTTGTRQLGTPQWLASGFVSHDFGMVGATGPLQGLSIGAGLRYVGGSDGTTSYKVVNGVTTFERFTTDDFLLVDTMLGYDLGRVPPGLAGFSLALNAANLFSTRHVTACPFNNSCYFGASRTVIGSLRYAW